MATFYPETLQTVSIIYNDSLLRVVTILQNRQQGNYLVTQSCCICPGDNEGGQMALHIVCPATVDTDAVRLLLVAGVNVNRVDGVT